MASAVRSAKISTSGKYAEKLINGHARPIGDEENAWEGKIGDFIRLDFGEAKQIDTVRLTLDADLNRKTIGSNGYCDRKCTVANVTRDMPFVHLPKTLIKTVRAEILTEDGRWELADEVTGIKRRLVYLKIGKKARAVRIIPTESYGNEEIKICTLDAR